MVIEKENKRNTKTNMVNIENSPSVLKHFKTMPFMPTQKAVYCNLPQSRGVIKQAIRINIKKLS